MIGLAGISVVQARCYLGHRAFEAGPVVFSATGFIKVL
jgi:hypothetical protein